MYNVSILAYKYMPLSLYASSYINNPSISASLLVSLYSSFGSIFSIADSLTLIIVVFCVDVVVVFF